MSSMAKATESTVPNRITHHWVVMPRMVCLASRSLLAVIQPVCPVIAPSVVIATGAANVSANQALKPIQKKISHRPWLQDSSQPTNGCSARLTNT